MGVNWNSSNIATPWGFILTFGLSSFSNFINNKSSVPLPCIIFFEELITSENRLPLTWKLKLGLTTPTVPILSVPPVCSNGLLNKLGKFKSKAPSIKVLSVISTLVVVEITSTFVVSSVILISVESEGDSTVRILIWGVKSKEVLLNAEPENDISIIFLSSPTTSIWALFVSIISNTFCLSTHGFII